MISNISFHNCAVKDDESKQALLKMFETISQDRDFQSLKSIHLKPTTIVPERYNQCKNKLAEFGVWLEASDSDEILKFDQEGSDILEYIEQIIKKVQAKQSESR